MGFLSALGDSINATFGMGENTTHTLDKNGENLGQLGDFAKRIDQSAERVYYEDGFIRDIRPRMREVIYQQPDVTIVVKKRMFSSLADNFRLELLEEKERIVVAASKKLFQNKCRLIANYERLTKIEAVVQEAGEFNTYLGPMVLDAASSLSTLASVGQSVTGSSPSAGSGFGDDFTAATNILRKVLAYSAPGDVTNWTNTDWDSDFNNTLGEGSGTFQITTVASVSTSTSVDFGTGSANITLEDPYNLLRITEADIDQALSDVANPFRDLAFAKFSENELASSIKNLTQQLAIIRTARNASKITIVTSEGTLLSSRVRAIMDEEGREIVFTYRTGNQNALKGIEDSKNVESAFASSFDTFTSGSVEFDHSFVISDTYNNGLNKEERKILTSIIVSYYTLFSYHASSQRKAKSQNASLNYARNRLRLLFMGKFLFQPNDVVNIFMTTRTEEDPVLHNGFSNAFGSGGQRFAQKFDMLFKGINESLGAMTSSRNVFDGILGGTSQFDDLLRLSTVGDAFPKWLWRMFKNQITAQGAGTAIFVGLVKEANGSWGDGKFTVSVSCEDNASYFSKGQVNFKPSAEVWNGTLYDPLTPFDISFDAATGTPITKAGSGDYPPLLPENQKLLKSKIQVQSTGPDKGKSSSEAKPSPEIGPLNIRNVFDMPGGMVYRWKQGIQTLTFTDRPLPASSIPQQKEVLLTAKPFAGQDVMNVLSLLITGQPYNYNTFLKAAINNGNTPGLGKTSNTPPAVTFLESLMFELQKNNQIWGNFIPFKRFELTTQAKNTLVSPEINILTQNVELTSLLNQSAQLQEQLMISATAADVTRSTTRNSDGSMSPRPAQNTQTIANNKKLQEINKKINQKLTEYQKTLNNNSEFGLQVFGNDINFDSAPVKDILLGKLSDNQEQKDRNDLEFRKRIGQYTLRRLWKTKANNDNNLFIVSDQYDASIDAQAFERRIGNSIELFNSEYSNVADQIKNVATILGLEIFANTQGHIEVRPPGYNKVPSSVFYKMFEDRYTSGVKVFPDFLEKLYVSELQEMVERLEIVEDEIRLRAIALGAKSQPNLDLGIYSIINRQVSGNGSFAFLTSSDIESGGKLTNFHNLMLNNPEDLENDKKNPLKTLKEMQQTIRSELNNQGTRVFDTVAQTSLFSALTSDNAPKQINIDATAFDKIRNRLQQKTNRQQPTIKELTPNKTFGISPVDSLSLINQIANFISERQKLITGISNSVKSLEEGLRLNAPSKPTGSFGQQVSNLFTSGDPDTDMDNSDSAAMFPNLFGRTKIPQQLLHMIEDEENDDLGYQSGKRFVISGNRISKLSLSERPPEHTMVAVKGLFGQGFVDSAASLKTSSDGNALTTAYAVDYDMWYLYGFRAANSIEAPFFNDPVSQCAPYAVSLLVKQRKNIYQGSVDVHGYNEFYQPGDVVYIEDVGMLFYVTHVSHSFTYGSLSTTLELKYGHCPGEYIPNTLDMLGKMMYSGSGFSTKYRVNRYDTLGAAKSIGAIVALNSNQSVSASKAIDNILGDKQYGQRNQSVLSNILLGISGALNQVSFQRMKTIIVIKYYTSIDSDNASMKTIAQSLKSWFVNPAAFDEATRTKYNRNSEYKMNPDDIVIEEQLFTWGENDTPTYSITQVDPASNSKTPDTVQGPSQTAIALARELESSTVVSRTPGNTNRNLDLDATQFRNLLFNNVIDILVRYEPQKPQKA